MTACYVAKSGDDLNDGSTWSLAKKTIQGAVDAGHDDIQIAGGVYRESVTLARSTSFTGVGRVVWDGGSGASGWCLTSIANAHDPTVVNIAFRNASVMYYMFSAGINYAIHLNATHCWFNCSPVSTFRYGSRRFSECVFHDKTIGATGGNNSLIFYFEKCTFANAQLYSPSTSDIVQCLFSGAPEDGKWIDGGFVRGSIENNCYDVVDASHTIMGYSSLAAWQAASGFDEHAIESADPLADAENGAYHLSHDSSILFAGPYGTRFGALPAAYVISPAKEATIWNAPESSTGLEQDASDQWLLSAAGSGTYRTQVLDLGSQRYIRRLVPIFDAGVTGEVLDYQTGESVPANLTLRWRASTTSFVDGDSSPAWSESNLDYDVGASYRYIQIELTPRTDGAY